MPETLSKRLEWSLIGLLRAESERNVKGVTLKSLQLFVFEREALL